MTYDYNMHIGTCRVICRRAVSRYSVYIYVMIIKHTRTYNSNNEYVPTYYYDVYLYLRIKKSLNEYRAVR